MNACLAISISYQFHWRMSGHTMEQQAKILLCSLGKPEAGAQMYQVFESLSVSAS